MKTLLRIDAGIRLTGSFSRTLGDYLISQWQGKNPRGKIIARDLHCQQLPHLSSEVASAFFAGNRDTDALKVSNELCDELKNSDELLITCPMYNFGIPSTLKAYFDHVVRVNETFHFSPAAGYKGLLENKKACIIFSMGGNKDQGGPGGGFENYLTGLLAFIGIRDVKLIAIEGTAHEKISGNWQLQFHSTINEFIQ